MSVLEKSIEDIKEQMRLHNIADKSFQDSQIIHNLETKDGIKEIKRMLASQTKASEGVINLYNDASTFTKWTVRVFIALAAIMTFVATMAAGVAGVQYIKSLLLK